MGYKISIIIPIFNCEKLVERSIHSILNQKWNGNLQDDIELILVDDCSTDNSLKLIKSYEEKYPNVTVLKTEKNSGHCSTPRNIAFNFVNSEYIMFLDADDEYDLDICQKLYSVIIKEDVDLVSCNFSLIDSISQTNSYVHYPNKNYIEKDDYLIADSSDAIFSSEGAIWTKLYKYSIIRDNNLTFKECIYEDNIFCVDYFLNCDKIAFMKNYFGYKYYIHDNSISNTVDLKLVLDSLDTYTVIFNLIKSYPHLNNLTFKSYRNAGEIDLMLLRISQLENKEDQLIAIKQLIEYEYLVDFDSSMLSFPFIVINYFMLKKKNAIAIFGFNLISFFRKFKFLRKLYRFLYFNFLDKY